MAHIIEAPLEIFHEEAHRNFGGGLLSAARRSPCYFTLPNVAALSDILRRNGDFFIEMSCYETLDRDLAILLHGDPDFGVCLTTFRTHNPHTAPIITSAINDRFGMSRYKKMQILTCLQEALSNAVIHGNLCIELERNSLEAFDRYYCMINDALMNPHYKDMRVYVRAWDWDGSFKVSITHEGNGLLNRDIIQDSRPELEKRAGRGLFIIQSLAEEVICDVECKSIDITFTY